MKVLSDIKYYKKLSFLLEKCIDVSPCDPDITDEQISAHKELNKFKEDTFKESDVLNHIISKHNNLCNELNLENNHIFLHKE